MQVLFFPANASSLTDKPLEFALLASCALVTSFTSKLKTYASLPQESITALATVLTFSSWARSCKDHFTRHIYHSKISSWKDLHCSIVCLPYDICLIAMRARVMQVP